ncbi:MAG: hypothetical protein ACE3L7_32705 [Candidatus Pristimantibacillus sp.]
MIKYIVTLTLGIIGFMLSKMSLGVIFSWWVGSEDWEVFTVVYLSPIYFLVIGFWIFKQKGRRGKHFGIYVVTFFVPWFFLISQYSYIEYQNRQYQIDQMELNKTTESIIKNKDDSVIHHLNLTNVYYRYTDDTVNISFEPDIGNTEDCDWSNLTP